MSQLARNMQISALTLLLAACSATTFHVGSDFDITRFSGKVERGTTTKNQVRSWLGEPAGTGVRMETDGARFDEWSYYFAAGNLSNLSGTELKTLQIKYDAQGVVQGYNWSSSVH